MRLVIKFVMFFMLSSACIWSQELKTYSDYTFVPGSKIIFYEDRKRTRLNSSPGKLTRMPSDA